jgi:hypothetical protein
MEEVYFSNARLIFVMTDVITMCVICALVG